MFTPFAWLALLAAPVSAAPLWLTFDVLNPSALGGHRILHLEDVVGPKRRTDVPGLPRPRAVLVFTVEPEGCRTRELGLCAAIHELLAGPIGAEGLAVGVVLASRDVEVELRRDIPYAGFRFPVALDVHGLLRRGLGAVRPGEFLVIQSSGENTKLSGPSNLADAAARASFLKEVERSFGEAIRRDKEAEE